ncbi:Tat proofreading chaperone DmsD [Pasteurella sp. P03HT]
MNQTEKLSWIAMSGRLLGALFYYAPDNQDIVPMLNIFRRPDWQEEWQPTPPSELVQAMKQGVASARLDLEYQTLFIGPDALFAAPWGSVYLDPESVIFGESLLRLREFLRQNNVEFVNEQHEPEDHIGLMLMLSAYLAEHHPTLLNTFLSEHFLVWSSRYLTLLSEQNESVFYRALATLTQLTLDGWKQALALDVKPARFYR